MAKLPLPIPAIPADSGVPDHEVLYRLIVALVYMDDEYVRTSELLAGFIGKVIDALNDFAPPGYMYGFDECSDTYRYMEV